MQMPNAIYRSLLRSQSFALLCLALLFIGGGIFVFAQDTPPTDPLAESRLPPGVAIAADVCAPAMTNFWTTATGACINQPEGFACNGGSAPQVQPEGAVSSAFAPTGALIEVGEIDAIRTPALDVMSGTSGVVYLRLPMPINLTLLAIGGVELHDVSPDGFAAWQSIVAQTDVGFPTCGAAPLSVVILQAPLNSSSRIVVNGASLNMNGTMLVHTTETNTVFVVLSGIATVTTFGQERVVYTGQQVAISHEGGDFATPTSPATTPIPYDLSLTRHIPVSLFDRPMVLPQPGTVITQGAVNLRSDSDITSGVITQVPGGEVLSVLGRTLDGEWYHVRRQNGESGWMSADLLLRNVGAIEAVYQATPIPPQRYGELGSRGRVVATSGVNLRVGPDVIFPAILTLNNDTTVNLVARSPYSPWVKVEVGGVEGWVALVNIETQAFLGAIPMDFNAPPLPPPTAIPGSFGNAFPDPDRD